MGHSRAINFQLWNIWRGGELKELSVCRGFLWLAAFLVRENAWENVNTVHTLSHDYEKRF